MIEQRLEVSSPQIMGILNLTPDSFYDGGRYSEVDEILKRIAQMVDQGAEIVDMGGMSSRPGAPEIAVEEELQRVRPVLQELSRLELDCEFSIDSYRAPVVDEALQAGIGMINDITALRGDTGLAELVADAGAKIVLMHMQGQPRTMQNNPRYNDVVEDIYDFFAERVEFAVSRGIDVEKIILDPGIGFGKELSHNQQIFQGIKRLKELGCPLLVGHSRKSYLAEILDKPVERRLVGTLATSIYLIEGGVDILRVHDVAEHRELLKTWGWLKGQRVSESG